MGLSSIQLEAFSEVAKTGSFSHAAKNLFVTQSALSQRVLALEKELATGLIIRDPRGLRLTSAGEELLRYCHIRESLETEVLTNISSDQKKDSGVIRIAGFSSVMRSVIMPSVDHIIKESPGITVEFFTREVRHLAKMMTNNEVDLIVTINDPLRQGMVSHLLGEEVNVLVQKSIGKNVSAKERSKIRERSEIYLDHDPEDQTTYNFFELNKESKSPKSSAKSSKKKSAPKSIKSPKSAIKLYRNFLADIYSIMDGVKLGWGSAILPIHMVKDEKDLDIVKNKKSLEIPVMLQYFQQPYYSKLHSRVVKSICENASKYLNP